MSTIGTALTTWEEFAALPDPPDEVSHYELHDGEVVLVMPSARPFHVYLQALLVKCLTAASEGRGWAMSEFPYRPLGNLQYWYADVAWLPLEDWQRQRTDEYLVYAPPLIIEVLSPSNEPLKIQRQRIAAFSGGTREFWVINADNRTVEVSVPGSSSRIFGVEESVPVAVLPGVSLPVSHLFQD